MGVSRVKPATASIGVGGAAGVLAMRQPAGRFRGHAAVAQWPRRPIGHSEPLPGFRGSAGRMRSAHVGIRTEQVGTDRGRTPICQPAQDAMRQPGGRLHRQAAAAWRDRHLAVIRFQLTNEGRQLLQAIPHLGMDVCSLLARPCGGEAAPVVSESLNESGCIVPSPAKSV
jgi:hypothetical protein